MLIKFKVENFKNFNTPLEIDFTKMGKYDYNTDCIKDDIISKMLIYGRNTTGKTNLGYAIMDIKNNLDELTYNINYLENYLNIDSNKNFAYFEYTFKFDNDIVVYSYKKSSSLSLFEEILKINDEIIFKCDFKNKSFSSINNTYTNVYKNFLYYSSNNYHANPLSFLWYVASNLTDDKSSVLFKIYNFVKHMEVNIFPPQDYKTMYEKLTKKIHAEKKLHELENFLNYMGIKCKLYMDLRLPNKPQICFNIKGKLLPFFENISNGVKNLVEIYNSIVTKKDILPISFLFLDNFDAFYHYELAERLLDYFKSELKDAQIIMTTHNTNLMSNKIMRPDCLFILSTDGNLTPLNKATNRALNQAHNLEKMYISGEFEDYE